jgi:hypothetical protein
MGDEHKNTDGRGLQSCFRTLKWGRLSSIGSIRGGVQIDLKLVGLLRLWRPGPIIPKPRIEHRRLSESRPPQNTLLFGGKLLPEIFSKNLLVIHTARVEY